MAANRHGSHVVRSQAVRPAKMPDGVVLVTYRKISCFFQRNFSDKTLIPFIGVWNYIGVGINSVFELLIGEIW